MATISSVAPTLLQSAVSQVLPSTSVNSSKNLSSPSATVSLGNATPAPLTYNASGQLGASQISQLEQAINNDVSNTLAGLFSGSSTSGSGSDALSQALVGAGATTPSANTSAAQAQQSLLNAQKLVNDTLSSLFSDTSTDSSSSSDGATSLLSSYYTPPVSGNS
jgi:hypothetical protein